MEKYKVWIFKLLVQSDHGDCRVGVAFMLTVHTSNPTIKLEF